MAATLNVKLWVLVRGEWWCAIPFQEQPSQILFFGSF